MASSSSLFCSAYEEQQQPSSAGSSSSSPTSLSSSDNNINTPLRLPERDNDDENDKEDDDDENSPMVTGGNNNACCGDDTTSSNLILPPPRSWFEEGDDDDENDNDGDVLPPEAYPSSNEEEEDDIDSIPSSDVEITHRQQLNNGGHDDVSEDLRKKQHDDFPSTEDTDSTNAAVTKGRRIYATQQQQQQQQQQLKQLHLPPPFLLAQQQQQPLPMAAPAPSWKELSQQVLPNAARELLTTSLQRMCYYSQKSYARGRWHRQYSDYGSPAAGYYRSGRRRDVDDNDDNDQLYEDGEANLPPFSSLPWVDRQLVQEWRTYLPAAAAVTDSADAAASNSSEEEYGGDDSDHDRHHNEEDDDEFDRARTLVPKTLSRPVWKKAEACTACHKTFGPTCLRHHCRNCGNSFCQMHSSYSHKLPHLNYGDIPERVCDACKHKMLDRNLAERVAWRLARCRDFQNGQLQPYFELGLDNLEHMALRISHALLVFSKKIPLGAQATVAVETVDVLRKYGLNGIYTIMLRQEFLAAADLLLKALGINRTAWPLSVHELSAAIFYALAQHRAMRGMYPEQEHLIHSLKRQGEQDEDDIRNNNGANSLLVCRHLPSSELKELVFYAPIALNFIYVDRSVDMQLLAAQQGWRLVYSYLDPEQDCKVMAHDRPASALFAHEQEKIACLAVRGTSTIHDVITDIRQVPAPFPEPENSGHVETNHHDDWMTVFKGQGVAVAGMARAAINLYREHIDALLTLAKQGYRIRMTGHSLGGAVSTLLGVLVYKDLVQISGHMSGEPPLRVIAYGSPSCVDLELAKAVESFVTTVVLHDDVVPRLTPTSCRGLLKHLLHIRETWVKEHFADDIRAFTDRAKTAWAPRWRGGFTLSAASSSSIKLKRYCRKKIQYGKTQLRYVKDKLVGDEQAPPKARILDQEEDYPETVTWRSESESNVASAATATPVIPEDPPRLVMDIMGAMDAGSEGMVVDGDEFFDPNEHLIESSSDDESDTTAGILDESLAQTNGDEIVASVSCVESFGDSDTSPSRSEKIESDGGGGDDDDDDCPGAAVVLEETPLPKMFIPGKIVHIYSHRGVYKAAYVPRDFRELRRISLAGNMLSDHKTQSYYDALLEVGSVRGAAEQPPRWTAFDEDDTCSCCASRFTWASTSDNEAQEARDKHNCRSCGGLVCNPCSSNHVPIPSIGLTVPARVCDRCYNDMDGLVMKSASETAETAATTGDDSNNDSAKPVRQREKRSAVVDELASRVQASALTTCS